MIKRSSSAEVSRLLMDVAGSDGVRRDAAAARLAIIGARAVDRVLAALDAATDVGHRVALLGVLEAIGDPRALPAAEAALNRDDHDVGLAALPIVRRLLASPDASVATRAIEVATGVVLDPERPESMRLAALDALDDLGPNVVAPVRKMLEKDPSEGVRARVGAAPRPGGEPATPSVPDVGRWASEGLPDDPEAVRSATLEQGPELPLPTLHHLLTRLREEETRTEDDERRQHWLAARAVVHQVLAERASRVALYDLRETLETTTGPLPVGMLAAIEMLGDPSLLDAVATAWSRTTDAWTRDRLAGAFADVVARHRLTKRHAVVKRIAARHPGLVVRQAGRTVDRPSR